MVDLNDWFIYDTTSKSCLRWKQNKYTGNPKRLLVSAGDEVGSITPYGYYETRHDGIRLMAHRVVWEINNNPIQDGLVIDHIDGNGSNNRIDNLRVVTRQCNSRNSKKRSHNTTGFTGVAKTKKIDKLTGKEYTYYTALWASLEGIQQKANYSIEKLGESSAFLLAFSHRQYEMELLDIAGAGYTDRHGN
jgi:hypothetical protein